MSENSKFNENYTDNNYVSMQELKTILRSSLIDELWKKILVYRNSYSKPLAGLKAINKKQLCITSTQSLFDRYSSFESKLMYFQTECVKASIYEDNKIAFQKIAYLLDLQLACKILGIKADDLSLKAIINGTYRDTDSNLTPVVAYYKALQGFESAINISDGYDFLGHEYAILEGTDELTYFFRRTNTQSKYTAAVIARVYDSAPANEIDSLMDSLFEFEQNDNKKGFIKALAMQYFVDYIKPFDNNNRLMAVLLGKWALARSSLGNVASILPFETAFLPSNKLNDYLTSIQQSGDFTYFVIYAMEQINPLLTTLLDELAKIKKNSIKKEFEGKEEVVKENLQADEIKAEIEEPKEPIKEEVKEVVPPKNNSPAIERIDPSKLKEGGLALSVPRASLSEKEIKDTARYIVETNPSIKKTQAYFFAGHCTIGRYYTIQDYKKCIRCAYETARTSMDLLAEQGFYKKLQLKNKFVYTPIKQGE